MTIALEFDTVIVGAGSAGCLLANRLSADPARQVLLIEAGGEDDWFWIKIPVGYLFTIANPRTDWCFKTEPDPGLNGRSIHYARGRVIGGCSSINAMIYMRGQASAEGRPPHLDRRGAQRLSGLIHATWCQCFRAAVPHPFGIRDRGPAGSQGQCLGSAGA